MIKFHLKKDLKSDHLQKKKEEPQIIEAKKTPVINTLPVAEKKENKPLYLVMQTRYFNSVLTGDKLEECRDKTDFYISRFCNVNKKTGEIISFKNYDRILMKEGYHANSRRLTIELKYIEIEKYHFVLHLGKILEKNF